MTSLLIAIQFLTILPVNLKTDVTNKQLGYSVLYYPVVGLIIAALLLVITYALQEQTSTVQAALVLSVWVIITGGLHIDGLADSADAWLGGIGNKERTLSIMKDPACGPIAVTTLLLLLLVKFVMLEQIINNQLWWTLIIACFIPRASIAWLLITTPYVRKQGIASDIIDYIPKQAVQYSFITIAVAMLLLGHFGVFVFSLAVLLLLRHLMLRRLNGTTGDTVGASVELMEAAILSYLVIFN